MTLSCAIWLHFGLHAGSNSSGSCSGKHMRTSSLITISPRGPRSSPPGQISRYARALSRMAFR
eukprot:4174925-Lingulodinium_polyedra.AAC.1